MAQAIEKDLEAWHQDRLRFPPYAYKFENGVPHPKKGWCMLDISEKETVMGFPVDYTFQCHPNGYRQSHPLETNDTRMTLIGNALHVGVVCNFLQLLCCELGLIPPCTVSNIMNKCKPAGSADMATLLLQPKLRSSIPKKISQDPKTQLTLAKKLFHLVSPKGADVMLSNPTENLPHYHRLRNSLNPKLWRWQVLAGWSWRPRGGSVGEHINRLE